MRLTQADRARVKEAVARAESETDGEIVTVVAARSDAYHDVALHWGVLGMLLVLAVLAAWPRAAAALWALADDPWRSGVPAGAPFVVALVLATLAFLLVRLLFRSAPLRLALTPGSTKARRVRRRAVEVFHVAAESRTRRATAVLLYLSLAERRAEIVADAAIHARVESAVWGDAMAALLEAVRDGRPGDGMADAVARIGIVLSRHFPRSADDTNELPDAVIEL